MTNRQIENQMGKLSFIRNIGKLSIGRSTSFQKENEDGSWTKFGKITCDTVGCRPRKFTVSGSEVIPNGGGYTYKRIISNLLDRYEIS